MKERKERRKEGRKEGRERKRNISKGRALWWYLVNIQLPLLLDLFHLRRYSDPYIQFLLY
jgi:hypothetical protein